MNLSSCYLDKAEMLRDTYRHFYTHLPGKVACTLYSALFIEKNLLWWVHYGIKKCL